MAACRRPSSSPGTSIPREAAQGNHPLIRHLEAVGDSKTVQRRGEDELAGCDLLDHLYWVAPYFDHLDLGEQFPRSMDPQVLLAPQMRDQPTNASLFGLYRRRAGRGVQLDG